MTVLPPGPRTSFNRFVSCVFQVDSKPIETVNSFVHLGHVITSSLCDDEDIVKRRGDFIGQVNNVICYFRKLNSFVRYKLFRSYCTSYYGCELWLLNSRSIDDFCIAWRKGLRKIWNIPPQTHCDLLPRLCNCYPLFDEFCSRSLKFARTCLNHQSSLVRFVSSHSIFYARGYSYLGRNASLCAFRYDATISDLFAGAFTRLISAFVQSLSDSASLAAADMLVDALRLREGLAELPHSETSLTKDDINYIIEYSLSALISLLLHLLDSLFVILFS
jgi:hypothetical protein